MLQNDDAEWSDSVPGPASKSPQPVKPSLVPALLVTGAVFGGILALTLPFVALPAWLGHSLPYMATPAKKVERALLFLRRLRRQRPTLMLNHPSAASVSATSINTKTNTNSRSFLDLGSGDGETVYQAVQQVFADDNGKTTSPYYSKCTGIELNSSLYLVSMVRRAFFWTPCQRRRSRFYCRDFFRTPASLIQESDTIFVFGIPSLMDSVSQMLALQKIRPGTHIICYRFTLPVQLPTDDGTTPCLSNTYQSDAVKQMKRMPSEKTVQSAALSPRVYATLIYDEEEMRIYECEETLPEN